MITQQDAAKELIRRKEAKQDLLEFTKYTFPNFEPARHHKLITEKLESVANKVEQGLGARLMIFMPPRHTKSELGSRRFPAWCLGNHPDWQIITATYSMDFAADFGRDVRSIVSSQEYQNIFPEVTLSQDVKAAARWNTNKGGVYVAAGVGGPLTGRGAHIALIDDPFKDWQSAYSEAIREHIWKWYLTVLRTRLMPGGAIVLIMTRWHDDDVAGRLIQQQLAGNGDEWEIISLPALADGPDILGRKEGEALWPEWFGEEELNKTKSVMPAYEWSALYQQKPVPDEGDYFKRDWFRWYVTPPEHLTIYITHDDAVSDKAGDFTEIGVWGVDAKENIYALAWWTGQTTADIWVDVLLDLVQLHKASILIGESGPIKKAVEPFLIKRMQKRKIFVRTEWLPSITDKATRASAFRGLANLGKVYLPKDQDWALKLLNQLLRFPAGVYDDKVDTCSLIGRAINQTWAPIIHHHKKKLPIEAQPTLNDIFRENSTPKEDGIKRIR